jgi:hypothetical protein
MNYLHRVSLRYPRTSAEAFKDHTYGAAVEKPAPRSGYGWLWWTIICAIAAVAVFVIAAGSQP